MIHWQKIDVNKMCLVQEGGETGHNSTCTYARGTGGTRPVNYGRYIKETSNLEAEPGLHDAG